MTPAARIAAAIPLLDAIVAGEPAERALTNWGRASRFAGSKDRQALRDMVFEVLRCRGSFARLGGSLTGRGLLLGWLRAAAVAAPEALFTGQGHAAAPLSPEEAALFRAPLPPSEELAASDWPDWLLPEIQADLGGQFAAISLAMRSRAPVFLRVNLRKASRAEAQAALARDGVETVPHALAETALEVTGGARKLAQTAAYLGGVVELQDAASQAVLGLPGVAEAEHVLDYCAGGGGKALALAALAPRARITAHDSDAGRMKDIAPRAARAGARITLAAPGRVRGQFDLVMVDAPCSGSGTWRRTPDAKWRFTAERLEELLALQASILGQASAHVAPGGRLLYMTCSLLDAENFRQISRFLETPPSGQVWRLENAHRLTPCDGGDGFYGALLRRE